MLHVMTATLVVLFLTKVLVPLPYVASPVRSWLADRATLSGSVRADSVSLLSAFELLAVLPGPGAPPFSF